MHLPHQGQDGQIEFKKLNEKHREIFRAARAKELKSLLDSGAISIMSREESREFEKNNPKHVLKSRFVDRWKPTDEFGVVPESFGEEGFDPAAHGGLAAKSRWCVVGWEDPHIHEIERAAPTPLTSSMYPFLQLSASRKWSARAKDAKLRRRFYNPDLYHKEEALSVQDAQRRSFSRPWRGPAHPACFSPKSTAW